MLMPVLTENIFLYPRIPEKSLLIVKVLEFIKQMQIESCSLFVISVYSSAISATNGLSLALEIFSVNTRLTIISKSSL